VPDIRDVVPTRSALLELELERSFVSDGHEFLDQKRLLLANEALRCLAELDSMRSELTSALALAQQSLVRAASRHGIEELDVHPIAETEFQFETRDRSFLGLTLVQAELLRRDGPIPEAVNPSPEARSCTARFRDLLALSARIAAVSTNLDRLFDEYRRTQRRVRALENVLLPELDRTIDHLEDQLESQDREEMLRARLAVRQSKAAGA